VLPSLSTSLESTPIGFFRWGCLKDRVYVRPLPRDITYFKTRTVEAIQSTDRETLSKARDELLYCLNVVRVTNGAHIEHL
jgi:hypothetical protein